MDKLVTAARSRLEAQEGTQADVATLESQRVELQLEMATIKLRSREERVRLARLIGRPTSVGSWTLEPWAAPTVPSRSEFAWINLALTNRPELRAISWQLRALNDDAWLTRFLPWEGATAGVESEHETDLGVGPSISTPIPIFDMGKAHSAKVAAEQL